MMNCNRCDGTGLLNHRQIPERIWESDRNLVTMIDWMDNNEWPNDVAICDCCGDGERWYGEPGSHYGSEDPQGPSGPYAYNGGLCECH